MLGVERASSVALVIPFAFENLSRERGHGEREVLQ